MRRFDKDLDKKILEKAKSSQHIEIQICHTSSCVVESNVNSVRKNEYDSCHMHPHIYKGRYIHIDHLLSRHVHHDGTANKYYSFDGSDCSSGFLISVCNSRDLQIFLFRPSSLSNLHFKSILSCLKLYIRLNHCKGGSFVVIVLL